jgi:tetratricopeptide (TPR) repeat protein
MPLYTLGELALYTGAWEDATNYLREAVTVAEHLGRIDNRRDIQALLAEMDLLQGDSVAALSRLRPFLSSAGWEQNLNLLLSLAAAYLANGDLDAAEDAAAKAVTEVTQQRLPAGLVDALRLQGAIAREQGNWNQAESVLGRAIELARDINYPWGEARLLHEYGSLHARRGDAGKACLHFGEAVSIFEGLGADPYRRKSEQALAESADPSNG